MRLKLYTLKYFSLLLLLLWIGILLLSHQRLTSSFQRTNKANNNNPSFPYIQESNIILPKQCQEIKNDNIDVLRHFSCNQSIKEKEINFLACGTKGYEAILPMYAFYALSFHENSHVEIVVENATSFFNHNKDALLWLKKHHEESTFCVREYNSNHLKRANKKTTWRFLEIPTIQAKYTYISDVDIFLTESVLSSQRIEQMRYFNIPYSNVLRTNQNNRLTGIILVKTREFYTEDLIHAQSTVDAHGNDEIFLYNLITRAGFNLPISNTTIGKFYASYRPLHGVHLSYSRGPGKSMCQTSLFEISKLLNVPFVNEYLCHDNNAFTFLSKKINDSYKQIQYNMSITTKGSTCAENKCNHVNYGYYYNQKPFIITKYKNLTLNIPTDNDYLVTWKPIYLFFPKNGRIQYARIVKFRNKKVIAQRSKGDCKSVVHVLSWLMDKIKYDNTLFALVAYTDLIHLQRQSTKDFLNHDISLWVPYQLIIKLGHLEEELYTNFGWTIRAHIVVENYITQFQLRNTCKETPMIIHLYPFQILQKNGICFMKDIWYQSYFPLDMIYPIQKTYVAFDDRELELQVPNDSNGVIECLYGEIDGDNLPIENVTSRTVDCMNWLLLKQIRAIRE